MPGKLRTCDVWSCGHGSSKSAWVTSGLTSDDGSCPCSGRLDTSKRVQESQILWSYDMVVWSCSVESTPKPSYIIERVLGARGRHFVFSTETLLEKGKFTPKLGDCGLLGGRVEPSHPKEYFPQDQSQAQPSLTTHGFATVQISVERWSLV